MTRSERQDVSKIVEEYQKKYPEAKRPLLRDAILKKYSVNRRTLDRHLKKAFEQKVNDNAVSPEAKVDKENSATFKGWDPPPDFTFSPKFEEAHRRKRKPYEVDDNPAQFPQVPFNWHNWSPYQLRVRLEVRVFLGGKKLGLINDPKGYYNGKTSIPVEPYRGGLRDGSFTLYPECAESTKETTIDVRARILDQNDSNKREYVIIRSWTFDPKENNWFYEPKSFTEEVTRPDKFSS